VGLILATILLDHPHIRFRLVDPAIVELSESSNQTLDSATRGALVWAREADGFHLRLNGGRAGRLRWDHATAGTIDRVRVRALVSVDGVQADSIPADRPTLFILQPGGEPSGYRMIARWHESTAPEHLDRILPLPDPRQSLRVILALASPTQSVVIHRLTIDGLATRPWIEVLRWGLLAGWLILIVSAAERLSRPMDLAYRKRLWWVLALLVAGLLAPPEMLETVKTLLDHLALPWSDEDGGNLDLNVIGHFTLFGLLALVAFQGRADLGLLRMTGVLAALAVATELMQHLVDGRRADGYDVLVDVAGVAAAALILTLARRLGWFGPAAAPSPSPAPDQDRAVDK
jgi:hypothetical protein